MEQRKFSVTITWFDGAGWPVMVQTLAIDARGRMIGIDCKHLRIRKTVTGDARSVIEQPEFDYEHLMTDAVECALISGAKVQGGSMPASFKP